ncbi:hypothetical protein L209DRAFT_322753 [Thermothelomyces heterothallicus CBS 203.75]
MPSPEISRGNGNSPRTEGHYVPQGKKNRDSADDKSVFYFIFLFLSFFLYFFVFIFHLIRRRSPIICRSLRGRSRVWIQSCRTRIYTCDQNYPSLLTRIRSADRAG